MVRVLPRVKSFGEEIAGIIGQGAGAGFSSAMKSRDEEKELEKENAQILKETKIDLTGIKDPQTRREVFSKLISGNQEKNKKIKELEGEEEAYKTIESKLGKDFADVWKASPVGGRTELLKYALDRISRGEDISDVLKDVKTTDKPSLKENIDVKSQVAELKNGRIPKNYDWPDYSKRPLGYTPKDWINEKSQWRKENAPVFQENKNKLKSNIADQLAIKKLKKLNNSNKLPQDLERFLINPATGELYGIAQITGMASPETQEWLKETARFQNRAKDAFGSRVTNFDLVSYMKQFPTLMNTPEGRERILRMMGINNELDQLYENALNDVYMHYGLNGISQEDAEKEVQKLISNDVERLHDEYLEIDKENQELESKKNDTGRVIRIKGPDGNEYEMDSSHLDELPEGYQII